MKKVAILQSSYIPWKGYFDIIHDVDLFIFYDDVQYTKNDWRNRNKIKVAGGTSWLTIPVSACSDELICNVRLSDRRWAGKHWKSFVQYYSRAPYFEYYRSFFEQAFLGERWDNLSKLNQYLIQHIARDFLGIKTEFRDSREYNASGVKLERLLDLLRKSGAERYVSGPAAKDYIDEEDFFQAGVELIFKDYSGYPEYSQFHHPFDHYVTVLDLLFHVGPDAPYYIWGWRENEEKGE